MAGQDEPVRWFDRLVLRADLVCWLLTVFGLVSYAVHRDAGDLQVASGLAVICTIAHADDLWRSARWMVTRARARVHDGGTPPAQG